ncbi:HEAT repeat domain-containing protein [Haloplanus rubicundus]|uniref:HEAT repeat domain-containing protein n=1 Tax=Haloplanus rubicundus TaxID=1547898 RepID=A0A345EDG7_9EURY|nr:HEAT repeat domain-containing protein [Haloplanus rubicundus]AXG06865.1 HEAT repeat domain-containing protein [Haloplanus rubicundus]AXG10239.1 HEAT repeat domain-containing protein [Haloplanus rubicundus]
MSLYQLEKDGDTDSLLDHLKLSDNPSIRQRAAEILGDVVDDEPQAVDALVRTAKEDDDEAVRGAAIDALDAIGSEAIERLVAEMAGVDGADGADWVRAEAFVETLSADRPELRMAAANALRRLGDSGALPALVETLDDPNPRVRARVARACGAIGDERATDALGARLDDPVGQVRREAADALAAIGTDRALKPLLDAAADENDEVRYAAVMALGGYRGPEAIDPLIGALDDDSDVVRRAAVFSIVELLASAPTEQSHRIRETVVDRLGAADRSVVDPLVELLEESSQPRERRNVAWLLGRVASDEGIDDAVGALVDALDADDGTTAQFAATSLVELDGERVEDELLALLEDPECTEAARSKAVFVLGKVGGERAREQLEELLDRADDEEVRKQAFAALSKLGGRR